MLTTDRGGILCRIPTRKDIKSVKKKTAGIFPKRKSTFLKRKCFEVKKVVKTKVGVLTSSSLTVYVELDMLNFCAKKYQSGYLGTWKWVQGYLSERVNRIDE